MTKKEVVLEDGRYLIYFSFAKKDEKGKARPVKAGGKA